jgi:hypothetical protein
VEYILRLVAIQALLSKQGSEKIMMLLQNTGEEHGPVSTYTYLTIVPRLSEI